LDYTAALETGMRSVRERSIWQALWEHSADCVLFLVIIVPLLIISFALGAGHAFAWQP
jgi:hypothetical protein